MLGHGRGVAAQVAGALARGDEVLEGHKEAVGSQAVPVAVVGAGPDPAGKIPRRGGSWRYPIFNSLQGEGICSDFSART